MESGSKLKGCAEVLLHYQEKIYITKSKILLQTLEKHNMMEMDGIQSNTWEILHMKSFVDTPNK